MNTMPLHIQNNSQIHLTNVLFLKYIIFILGKPTDAPWDFNIVDSILQTQDHSSSQSNLAYAKHSKITARSFMKRFFYLDDVHVTFTTKKRDLPSFLLT